MKLSLPGPCSVLVAAVMTMSACAKSETKPQSDAQAQGAHQPESGPHNDNAVTFSADAQRQARLRTEPIARREVETTLTTTGELTADQDREAHVSPRVSGRVLQIMKTVGDAVRAGEILATIESTELGQAQSAFLEAQARFGQTRGTCERQRQLFRDDLIAKKELLAAENQVRLAEIEMEKTRNQLQVLGFGPDRMATLARTRRIDASLPIVAPIPGVITTKHITIGEHVTPGDDKPIYTISDPSRLWANATLFEKDLARVRSGQKAIVTTPAYPGMSYVGQVSLISTALAEDTRTAKARIVVTNPDRTLKPEMFANIRITVGSQTALALPESALLLDKQATFSFVQTGPETFEKRPVQVGAKAGIYFPVLSGLKAGDNVVVAGGFTLKSELLKASFGEHEH